MRGAKLQVRVLGLAVVAVGGVGLASGDPVGDSISFGSAIASYEVEHFGVLRIGDLGDRDGLLMDIQTDVQCARVLHGWPFRLAS